MKTKTKHTSKQFTPHNKDTFYITHSACLREEYYTHMIYITDNFQTTLRQFELIIFITRREQLQTKSTTRVIHDDVRLLRYRMDVCKHTITRVHVLKYSTGVFLFLPPTPAKRDVVRPLFFCSIKHTGTSVCRCASLRAFLPTALSILCIEDMARKSTGCSGTSRTTAPRSNQNTIERFPREQSSSK